MIEGKTSAQPTLETFNRDMKKIQSDNPTGQGTLMYCGLALLASATSLVNLGASSPAGPLFPVIAASIGKTLISPETETQIGKEIDGYFQGKVGFCNDEKLNARLNEVGSKIIGASALPEGKYEFRILDMEQPNAHTAPGRIYMTREMMELLSDDSNLAFFIGHEVGHLEDRDGMEALGTGAFRDTIKQGTMLLRDAPFGDKTVGEIRRELLSNFAASSKKFGWENELNADRRGAEIMIKAGYKAEEAVNALKIPLKKLEELGYQWNPETSEHPDIESRVAVVEKAVKNMVGN